MTFFFGGTFGAENAIYRFTHPKNTSNAPRNIVQLLVDHRLALFGSVVGLAVAGTGWRIMQNKNLSGAQKFMNIRLYGQIAGLLAIAMMAGVTAAHKTVTDEERKKTSIDE